MAAVVTARRGKPHPPVGDLLAQLPNILGDEERRAATAVAQLMTRADRPRGARSSASAAARNAARPR